MAKPTKYSSKLIPKIHEYASQGMHVREIANKLGIHFTTIYNWAKKHDEFRDAWDLAMQASASWWLSYTRDNLDNKFVKDRLLQFMLMAKFGLKDTHTNKLPELRDCKTHVEKCDVVTRALADGVINADEASKISNTLATAAKIEEVTELRQKLDELEEKLKDMKH